MDQKIEKADVGGPTPRKLQPDPHSDEVDAGILVELREWIELLTPIRRKP
jgi:hypothetical protein